MFGPPATGWGLALRVALSCRWPDLFYPKARQRSAQVTCALNHKNPRRKAEVLEMARLTGLEPATPGVTGRYSNQLSYNRAMRAE